MSHLTDLDKERKKYARRKTVQRLIALALVSAVAFVGYTMRFEIASQGMGVVLTDALDVAFDNTGFPVELDSAPSQLTGIGSRPIVVMEGQLSGFNSAGNQVIDERLTSQHPIAVPCGKRLLLYAQGGYDLSIRMGGTVLYKDELTYPIYTAALSKSGICALSTGAVGYQSRVTVLDTQYQKIFEWASSESIIQVLALDKRGTRCVAGALRSERGTLSSIVRLFELSGGVEQWSLELPDELILSAVVLEDGGVVAVTDRSVTKIGADGTLQQQFSFEGETLDAFVLEEDGTATLALGDYTSSHQIRLIRLDTKCRNIAQITTPFAVRTLMSYGEGLIAFCGDRTVHYDAKFTPIQILDTPDASHAVRIGDYLYYTTARELYRSTLR